MTDIWGSGQAYESYIGRWSRAVAREFVPVLGVPPGGRWLDVGCGTGALTQAILAAAEPGGVVGVDPSEGFVRHAQSRHGNGRVSFEVGGAEDLPFPDASFEAVVSGLVLNFVPDTRRAASEAARVAAPGGTVAAYVWDYAEGMQLIRGFWDAAVALDPAAAELDEAKRFPLCAPGPLRDLFEEAGLESVETGAIEAPTVFSSFDELWSPFLSGNGPAPAYAAGLDDERRGALQEQFRRSLPAEPDGSIALSARAWTVSGRTPGRPARS